MVGQRERYELYAGVVHTTRQQVRVSGTHVLNAPTNESH